MHPPAGWKPNINVWTGGQVDENSVFVHPPVVGNTAWLWTSELFGLESTRIDLIRSSWKTVVDSTINQESTNQEKIETIMKQLRGWNNWKSIGKLQLKFRQDSVWQPPWLLGCKSKVWGDGCISHSFSYVMTWSGSGP